MEDYVAMKEAFVRQQEEKRYLDEHLALLEKHLYVKLRVAADLSKLPTSCQIIKHHGYSECAVMFGYDSEPSQ